MKFSTISRYAVLAIFPVGWWIVDQQYSNYSEFIQKFNDLTTISFLASATILFRLKDTVTKQIHLWAIFAIFLLGHYVELFLKIYWKLTDSKYLKVTTSPSEKVWLSSPNIIIDAYEVATVCLCFLAVAIYWVTKKSHKASSRFRLDQLKILDRKLSQKVKTTEYVVFLIILGFLLLAIQISFDIGRQIGFGVPSVVLPFKLAGIIHYANSAIVPALFLMLIYLSDIANDRLGAWIGTFAYLIHSTAFAIITTSKNPITLSLASLFIIWKFSNRLDRLRLSLLAMVVPLLPFTFSVLMGLRFARGIGEIGNISKIPQVLETLSNISQTTDDDSSLYTLLVRFNGMDTLMDFVNYCKFNNIYFSIDRIPDLLNLDFIYGSEILRIKGYGTGAFALGISPGFTGSLYFILLNAWAVGFSLFLFTILWDKLFHFFLDSSLLIKPLVLVQIAMIGGLFISEGAWLLLPVQIGIVFGIAFLGESLANRIMENQSRSNQSSNKFTIN